MRNIDIQFIPHDEQRYNTVGDWWYDDATADFPCGTARIRISKLTSGRMMAALALHELVEMWLCQFFNVDQMLVDAFDRDFMLLHPNDDAEPGDDPEAPYHIQHGFATAVERMFIAACGINWKEYDDILHTLMLSYRGVGVQ